jgi:hypothetical protein
MAGRGIFSIVPFVEQPLHFGTTCQVDWTVMQNLAAVLLLPLAILNGQASQKDSIAALVEMHRAWGSKASTPNASLTLKEAERSEQVLKLRLIASGVPKEGIYSIVAWPVTQRGPAAVLIGVTLDASGVAVCAGKPGTCGSADKPDDPIDLVFRPAPGEPVRLGLVSADGATKVFAKAVPVPLRGEDQGCTVEVTLLTPGAELVLIEGDGFPAGREIAMDSKSDPERQGGKGKTDADGRYASALLPYLQGVAGGTTEVTLKAGKCAPSVNFNWGRRN